jgi:alkyl sulfatase BDS1-like metallo-beta-lactamase superfamily hydrolase
MDVLGIEMQFFTKYGSDDKVHTTVWLPERRILFTTMLWNSPPQLYTLRGDVFRDPSEWIDGLRFTLDFEPDVLVSAAAKPIVGKEKIKRALEVYMDGARFVLDQTLRGILAGLGPDDLRHFVKFPDYLDEPLENLQSYGEVSSYPPAIFYQTVGWYDNDAANLKPIPPVEEARRWVSLVGGASQMLAAAQDALNAKEYSWAAKLANQVYLIDGENEEARRLKAEALRQMAYVSTGANDRAHLISQALELEGKTRIARVVPPQPQQIVADPTKYVEYFRVRIDPSKSVDIQTFIRFDFGDGGSVGLDVRRAVAEFVPEPDTYSKEPDLVLAMSADTWAELYLGQTTPASLIETGAIAVTGDATGALDVLNAFDQFRV